MPLRHQHVQARLARSVRDDRVDAFVFRPPGGGGGIDPRERRVVVAFCLREGGGPARDEEEARVRGAQEEWGHGGREDLGPGYVGVPASVEAFADAQVACLDLAVEGGAGIVDEDVELAVLGLDLFGGGFD